MKNSRFSSLIIFMVGGNVMERINYISALKEFIVRLIRKVRKDGKKIDNIPVVNSAKVAYKWLYT